MQAQIILILIFAILVAVFAIQNTVSVVIKFFLWNANLSLVLVILGSVAAGALFIFLINAIKQIKVNRERKELNRQIAALSKEKEDLERSLAAYQNSGAAKTAPAQVSPPPPPQVTGEQHPFMDNTDDQA